MNNLRFYAFCNFYLSGIQAGIQTGHCATKMSSKYRNHPDKQIQKVFHDWEDDGVTIIVLNGGTAANIKLEYDWFEQSIEKYGNSTIPYGYFAEEVGALHPTEPCITCWGFIVSPKVYAGPSINYIDRYSIENQAWSTIQDKELAR